MPTRTPNAICTVCGKPYWRQPTRLARSLYCSQSCKISSRKCEFSKDDLVQLYYTKKWSMQQIAEHYTCSANKVVYWMKEFQLERRGWSEATYVYKNPKGDPFTITLPETIEEKELFALAIGLYLGEGTKKGIHNVAMVNSDPKILRIFIQFLEKFCGIARSDLRAGLNIFADCDVAGAIVWWTEQLKINAKQFYQPLVRQPKSAYSNKSERGTVSLTFSNTKLLQQIKEWCNEYAGRFTR
jgi:hypothetical protein